MHAVVQVPRRSILVAAAALVIAGAACERWARPAPATSERRLVVAGVTRTYLLHAGGEAKPGARWCWCCTAGA